MNRFHQLDNDDKSICFENLVWINSLVEAAL